MTRTSIVASLIATLFVAGCSTPPPEPAYYLLRGGSSEGVGEIEGDLRVGLGRIIVAPYLLMSPGLVVETAPGEVRPARLHQWAEPLDSGLRWFLRSEIARALGWEVGGGLVDRGDWEYTIDVYIARLHGTMSGSALIEAVYVIRPMAGAGPLRDYRFSKSLPLADDGYPALAQANLQLIAELAHAVAGSLREVKPALAE
jgi:uncharacterized lipoprotein YmbA